MAVCPKYKIDSNSTGLRYAEEECLKQLPVAATAVAATGTITMNGVGVADDTVTVAGTVFTLVDDTPGVGEVEIGATAADTATALAAAINALGSVNAAAVGAVITVTAAVPGAAGNAITMAEGTDATLSGATLSGGSDAVDAPKWIALEPNSYSDFGGQITTVARNPINQSRQRKKGVVTDVEASGGFQQDLTFYNFRDLAQGFMFADLREKTTTAPNNGTQVAITNVAAATDRYSVVGGDSFVVGQLVYAQGFAQSANNGLKTVAAVNAAYVQVSQSLVDEASPPADALVAVVGFRAPDGTLAIELNGDLVRLVSTGPDLSELGLIPGEWLYIGGDQSVNGFDDNGGFARIGAIDPDGEYLELDKVDWPEPVAEAGTGKLIDLYFGQVLKNESDPALIKRRTYQLERTLGNDANGVMSEYLVGAMPNELTLNAPQADKVTMDMSFIACDHEARTGAQGVKAGDRVGVVEGDAYNTSSNFSRIKMAIVNDDASVTPLFAFASDLTLTVNNNGSTNKAVGTLGAFDLTAGTFEVGGEFTAYFASVDAVQAVRNNEDVTVDVVMVKDNQGIVYDVPLLALGNGRLTVEQDQAIMIPLETNAAESKFGHTLLWQFFPYLPDAAEL